MLGPWHQASAFEVHEYFNFMVPLKFLNITTSWFPLMVRIEMMIYMKIVFIQAMI